MIHLPSALRRFADSWRASEWPPIVLLLGIAGVVVYLVDPRGDFPLNDDWGYAQAVQRLLEEGEIRLTDFGSMTLLTQILWGAAFSKLWGFSFETLRASTLVLGLVGLLSWYGTLRELRVSRGLALLAVATLLANPLFLLLSHTFMTDVPFLGVSGAATFFLVRGFQRGSPRCLVGALLLALAATFLRQLGLALFVGFALAVLWRRWREARAWLVAAAPPLGTIALLRWYQSWLASRGSLPENYDLQWRQIRDGFSAAPFERIGQWFVTSFDVLIYVGLFAAPLAAVWLLQPR